MADQLTRDDLRTMTATEVTRAFREGRCNALLGASVPMEVDLDSCSLREALRTMTPAEIAARLRAGDFDDLLAGRGPQS